MARPLARAVLRRAARHPARDETTEVARGLQSGAAVLAFSVLADSGLEHYRGRYFNRAMYIAPTVSGLALAASIDGMVDRGAGAERRREVIYALGALTGIVGTGFHLYNVGKREGGFSFINLFYGAPLGAPWALLLSGALGRAAEAVRETKPGRPTRLFGLPAGRVLAGITSGGLLGTVAEVGLLHFRGAYHNPFMFLPVSIPPVAAGLMAEAAGGKRRERRFARFWMKLTALLGLGGVGFHIYGVSRNMGGWRNWSQNLLNGPPLPAPPSFTGLALAGLAALRLLENPRDA